MKFPGETWVGNLYQKFEAVCNEVDGLVSQDIRNLESHVQSVGDEVMKLCSNVKDLLPSSLGDPVEVEAKSVSGDVDCVTNASEILPEMDVTDSPRSNETHDQVSDEDLLETHEEPSGSSSELPFSQSESSVIIEDHDEEEQSSEVPDRNSDSFTDEKQSASCGSGSGSTLVSSNSGLLTKEEEESPSNFRESISPDEHLCERAISVFCDQNHSKGDMISENSDGNSTALLELSHHCEADFFSCKSNTCNWSVIDIGSPCKEKAEDVDSGLLASTDFSNDEGSKPKQMEFSVRFEGSCCVFVERESIQGDCGRAPSRKKGIKSAFWRRKKVVEKEYRQLGLWYGDIDAELDECSRQNLISNKHSSSSREESGWEVL